MQDRRHVEIVFALLDRIYSRSLITGRDRVLGWLGEDGRRLSAHSVRQESSLLPFNYGLVIWW